MAVVAWRHGDEDKFLIPLFFFFNSDWQTERSVSSVSGVGRSVGGRFQNIIFSRAPRLLFVLPIIDSSVIVGRPGGRPLNSFFTSPRPFRLIKRRNSKNVFVINSNKSTTPTSSPPHPPPQSSAIATEAPRGPGFHPPAPQTTRIATDKTPLCHSSKGIPPHCLYKHNPLVAASSADALLPSMTLLAPRMLVRSAGAAILAPARVLLAVV